MSAHIKVRKALKVLEARLKTAREVLEQNPELADAKHDENEEAPQNG